MEEDAARIGRRPVLWTVAEVKARLEEMFPGRYEFSPVRRSFDYLYETKKMVSLAGKKYQPKRNFISRFKTQNPDWTYESICPDGDPELCRRQLEECRAMTDEWCALNGCIHDESMQMEACAVRKALEDFIPLKLRGGMLRTGGRLVAYTLGERLNSDTFIVHAEKAFSDVTGAYPMISRTFLEHEAAGLQYVNREDDAGDEGLRKAKLSWNPAYMLEKYLAVPR